MCITPQAVAHSICFTATTYRLFYTNSTNIWLLNLFNHVLIHGTIPRLFKQVKVDAVLKQGNRGDVSADQISLFEKITLHRMENIIDQNTPRGQGGIKCGLGRCDQVLFLITMMESGFQRMEKTEGEFFDLTAAYVTVWRYGLLPKFSKIIPCGILVTVLENMLSNRR